MLALLLCQVAHCFSAKQLANGQGLVRVVMLFVLLAYAGGPVRAQQGNIGAHDPSTIIKDGNKYWVFYTGQGVRSKYSTDLINWTNSQSVFTTFTRPSWIASKVPAFVNEYWAPECIFMNGKFYLYYSCSTFGSQRSGIGLATNVTLDPANPNYNWVDEGEVVSSMPNANGTANNSAPNAIDPALYRDANNNLWFTYGSFYGGIAVMQLNPATGKPLNGVNTPQTIVANNPAFVNNSYPEAPYVKLYNGFYYLFINRGACCQRANSTTYRIQVGRSTSPTGPFVDKNGLNLNNNGGSPLLSTSGRYIGPGHAGIFEENGVSYFSHHYYDYEDNGNSKLDIAKLTWDATGWPVVSRDWLASGRYSIATAPGMNSLVWQAQGCTGAAGQPVTQSTRTGGSCQEWDVTSLGNGNYKIASALGGLTVGVATCSSANGAALELGTYTNLSCQQFHLNQASDGSLVFASVNGNRVVEVPFASSNPGTQLALYDYNGCLCQHWYPTFLAPLATASSRKLANVSIYPVPAERGSFTVDLGSRSTADAAAVVVYNVQGRVVYREAFKAHQVKLAVEAGLQPGIYQVQVRQGNASFTQKVSVL
ncbi:family 43 glycosylhydrolase [Hymenobacter sp.]|jgi:arabinan endo-1,5-alpha-L-arabinosidase|uniref:family 43 glycosylhydrolase n=1 Tax=Hymenobacter sp. TaxID=1898978 RepID=UPI002ED8CE53